MTAGTRFSLQCAAAWATCWGIAAACFAYIRHTRTPKGGPMSLSPSWINHQRRAVEAAEAAEVAA